MAHLKKDGLKTILRHESSSAQRVFKWERVGGAVVDCGAKTRVHLNVQLHIFS